MLLCGIYVRSILLEQTGSQDVVCRLILLRSDSELHIFTFRSEERMGLVQSDIAKSDGIKPDLRIQWPKSSDFGPACEDSGPSHYQVEKWNTSRQVRI